MFMRIGLIKGCNGEYVATPCCGTVWIDTLEGIVMLNNECNLKNGLRILCKLPTSGNLHSLERC